MTQPLDFTRRITRRQPYLLPPKPPLAAGALRLACGLLRANGAVVLEEDWCSREHRIGVVAKDGGALCFVAVLARPSPGRGGAAPRLVALRRDIRVPRGRRVVRPAPPQGGGLMAMGRSYSVGVLGVDGLIIEVEAYVGSGPAGVCLVGLPDAALQESRDRIRAAVHNSGASWPQGRVTLALSPATVRKVGSMHDAALDVAVLAASGSLPKDSARRAVILGELALDGRLRPVRGVLPAALAARRAGWEDVVVPEANLAEAGLVTGIRAHGAPSLRVVARRAGTARPCAEAACRARPLPRPR